MSGHKITVFYYVYVIILSTEMSKKCKKVGGLGKTHEHQRMGKDSYRLRGRLP